MFCSKCGKTLPHDALNCPSCGLEVGQSRFEGSSYTSAQAHILPGDDVHQVLTKNFSGDDLQRILAQNYTRTTYTSDSDAAESGDVDSRTTYRPTYDGDVVPEEVRRDLRAAVAGEEAESTENTEAAAEAPAADMPESSVESAFDAEDAAEAAEEPGQPVIENDVITYADTGDDLTMEDLDLSRFRARPIESAGQSGISADVSEMMQEIEAEQPRRLRGFGRRRPVYGDYAEENQDFVAAEGDYADVMPEENPDMIDEQAEVFDDIDDEEFDELRHSTFGVAQILKIVAAVVVVAALVVGGVLWMNYIRDRQSAAPIENVREALYVDGVALIENHASAESVEKVLTDYRTSSDLSALQTQLTASSTAVTALMPADATENEQVFMQALSKIETNITNCIISDAIAVGSGDADAVAKSDERWQVVNNSIAMLKEAQSTAELTAIINGEVIDIEKQAEATPTPEPKVNYNTLSKGDKSDEVVKMQTRLIELGYMTEAADGDFGSKTQTAVKIFQQVAGLTVNGIADSDTLNAMYADDAPRADLAIP